MDKQVLEKLRKIKNMLEHVIKHVIKLNKEARLRCFWCSYEKNPVPLLTCTNCLAGTHRDISCGLASVKISLVSATCHVEWFITWKYNSKVHELKFLLYKTDENNCGKVVNSLMMYR